MARKQRLAERTIGLVRFMLTGISERPLGHAVEASKLELPEPRLCEHLRRIERAAELASHPAGIRKGERALPTDRSRWASKWLSTRRGDGGFSARPQERPRGGRMNPLASTAEGPRAHDQRSDDRPECRTASCARFLSYAQKSGVAASAPSTSARE